MRRALLVSPVLLALPALASCSESFSRPEDAVGTFLRRLASGDVSGARACVAADEQATAQLKPGRGPVSYSVGRADVRGDQAMVPVVITEGGEDTDSVWVAVREGGGWRVSVMRTLTRHMFQSVKREMDDLDESASDQERIDALRRGMQGARPGR